MQLFERLVQRDASNVEWVYQLPRGCQLTTQALLLAGRPARPVIPGLHTRPCTGAAQPAMQGDDDNAARRWMVALALGEEAAALQALGQQREAAAAARRALAHWRAGAAVPGLFAPGVQRDEHIAGR